MSESFKSSIKTGTTDNRLIRAKNQIMDFKNGQGTVTENQDRFPNMDSESRQLEEDIRSAVDFNLNLLNSSARTNRDNWGAKDYLNEKEKPWWQKYVLDAPKTLVRWGKEYIERYRPNQENAQMQVVAGEELRAILLGSRAKTSGEYTKVVEGNKTIISTQNKSEYKTEEVGEHGEKQIIDETKLFKRMKDYIDSLIVEEFQNIHEDKQIKTVSGRDMVKEENIETITKIRDLKKDGKKMVDRRKAKLDARLKSFVAFGGAEVAESFSKLSGVSWFKKYLSDTSSVEFARALVRLKKENEGLYDSFVQKYADWHLKNLNGMKKQSGDAIRTASERFAERVDTKTGRANADLRAYGWKAIIPNLIKHGGTLLGGAVAAGTVLPMGVPFLAGTGAIFAVVQGLSWATDALGQKMGSLLTQSQRVANGKQVDLTTLNTMAQRDYEKGAMNPLTIGLKWARLQGAGTILSTLGRSFTDKVPKIVTEDSGQVATAFRNAILADNAERLTKEQIRTGEMQGNRAELLDVKGNMLALATATLQMAGLGALGGAAYGGFQSVVSGNNVLEGVGKGAYAGGVLQTANAVTFGAFHNQIFTPQGIQQNNGFGGSAPLHNNLLPSQGVQPATNSIFTGKSVTEFGGSRPVAQINGDTITVTNGTEAAKSLTLSTVKIGNESYQVTASHGLIATDGSRVTEIGGQPITYEGEVVYIGKVPPLGQFKAPVLGQYSATFNGNDKSTLILDVEGVADKGFNLVSVELKNVGVGKFETSINSANAFTFTLPDGTVIEPGKSGSVIEFGGKSYLVSSVTASRYGSPRLLLAPIGVDIKAEQGTLSGNRGVFGTDTSRESNSQVADRLRRTPAVSTEVVKQSVASAPAEKVREVGERLQRNTARQTEGYTPRPKKEYSPEYVAKSIGKDKVDYNDIDTKLQKENRTRYQPIKSEEQPTRVAKPKFQPRVEAPAKVQPGTEVRTSIKPAFTVAKVDPLIAHPTKPASNLGFANNTKIPTYNPPAQIVDSNNFEPSTKTPGKIEVPKLTPKPGEVPPAIVPKPGLPNLNNLSAGNINPTTQFNQGGKLGIGQGNIPLNNQFGVVVPPKNPEAVGAVVSKPGVGAEATLKLGEKPTTLPVFNTGTSIPGIPSLAVNFNNAKPGIVSPNPFTDPTRANFNINPKITALSTNNSDGTGAVLSGNDLLNSQTELRFVPPKGSLANGFNNPFVDPQKPVEISRKPLLSFEEKPIRFDDWSDEDTAKIDETQRNLKPGETVVVTFISKTGIKTPYRLSGPVGNAIFPAAGKVLKIEVVRTSAPVFGLGTNSAFNLGSPNLGANNSLGFGDRQSNSSTISASNLGLDIPPLPGIQTGRGETPTNIFSSSIASPTPITDLVLKASPSNPITVALRNGQEIVVTDPQKLSEALNNGAQWLPKKQEIKRVLSDLEPRARQIVDEIGKLKAVQNPTDEQKARLVDLQKQEAEMDAQVKQITASVREANTRFSLGTNSAFNLGSPNLNTNNFGLGANPLNFNITQNTGNLATGGNQFANNGNLDISRGETMLRPSLEGITDKVSGIIAGGHGSPAAEVRVVFVDEKGVEKVATVTVNSTNHLAETIRETIGSRGIIESANVVGLEESPFFIISNPIVKVETASGAGNLLYNTFQNPQNTNFTGPIGFNPANVDLGAGAIPSQTALGNLFLQNQPNSRSSTNNTVISLQLTEQQRANLEKQGYKATQLEIINPQAAVVGGLPNPVGQQTQVDTNNAVIKPSEDIIKVNGKDYRLALVVEGDKMRMVLMDSTTVGQKTGNFYEINQNGKTDLGNFKLVINNHEHNIPLSKLSNTGVNISNVSGYETAESIQKNKPEVIFRLPSLKESFDKDVVSNEHLNSVAQSGISRLSPEVKNILRAAAILPTQTGLGVTEVTGQKGNSANLILAMQLLKSPEFRTVAEEVATLADRNGSFRRIANPSEGLVNGQRWIRAKADTADAYRQILERNTEFQNLSTEDKEALVGLYTTVAELYRASNVTSYSQDGQTRGERVVDIRDFQDSLTQTGNDQLTIAVKAASLDPKLADVFKQASKDLAKLTGVEEVFVKVDKTSSFNGQISFPYVGVEANNKTTALFRGSGVSEEQAKESLSRVLSKLQGPQGDLTNNLVAGAMSLVTMQLTHGIGLGAWGNESGSQVSEIGDIKITTKGLDGISREQILHLDDPSVRQVADILKSPELNKKYQFGLAQGLSSEVAMKQAVIESIKQSKLNVSFTTGEVAIMAEAYVKLLAEQRRSGGAVGSINGPTVDMITAPDGISLHKTINIAQANSFGEDTNLVKNVFGQYYGLNQSVVNILDQIRLDKYKSMSTRSFTDSEINSLKSTGEIKGATVETAMEYIKNSNSSAYARADGKIAFGTHIQGSDGKPEFRTVFIDPNKPLQIIIDKNGRRMVVMGVGDGSCIQPIVPIEAKSSVNAEMSAVCVGPGCPIPRTLEEVNILYKLGRSSQNILGVAEFGSRIDDKSITSQLEVAHQSNLQKVEALHNLADGVASGNVDTIRKTDNIKLTNQSGQEVTMTDILKTMKRLEQNPYRFNEIKVNAMAAVHEQRQSLGINVPALFLGILNVRGTDNSSTTVAAVTEYTITSACEELGIKIDMANEQHKGFVAQLTILLNQPKPEQPKQEQPKSEQPKPPAKEPNPTENNPQTTPPAGQPKPAPTSPGGVTENNINPNAPAGTPQGAGGLPNATGNNLNNTAPIPGGQPVNNGGGLIPGGTGGNNLVEPIAGSTGNAAQVLSNGGEVVNTIPQAASQAATSEAAVITPGLNGLSAGGF